MYQNDNLMKESDNKDVSNYVNRIVSKDELVLGSDCYSEVELVNIQDKNGKYINQIITKQH